MMIVGFLVGFGVSLLTGHSFLINLIWGCVGAVVLPWVYLALTLIKGYFSLAQEKVGK